MMNHYKYVRENWVEEQHYGLGFKKRNWKKYKKMYKRIAKRKCAKADSKFYDVA